MRVLLYSRYGQYPKSLEPLIKGFGLEIVSQDPEVVITYGGDGTLLGAERDYPGVPKIPLRDSEICHLCTPLPNEKVLEMLVNNQLKTKELIKLEAVVEDKKLIALNDVVIAHKFPNSALRFRVYFPDGLPAFLPDDLIGDGFVISTPFGSTGYFYSITNKPFAEGIGLAFNNIHGPKVTERVLGEDTEIKAVITRGPGVLAADNNPNLINLLSSDKILIKKAPESARILMPAGQQDANQS